MNVIVAAVLAVVAAVLFAVAATAQNGAVAAVIRGDALGEEPAKAAVIGGRELRSLARSRVWVAGISVNAVASILHAGALVLAPVAIVQPIGVLSVPFAVVLAAGRTHRRPPVAVQVAVAVCLVSVVGFVTLANAQLGTSPAPRFLGVVAAALGAGAVSALLALWGSRRSGWVRCVGFAASGATAFGLVSALMRLVALHLSSGVNDLDDVGVWLPAAGIALALVFGGWAVQQAHAVGAPAVVLGCLTVIDPLVAVVLGATMLGEGRATSAGVVAGLIGFAVLALSAAVLLPSAIRLLNRCRRSGLYGRCRPSACTVAAGHGACRGDQCEPDCPRQHRVAQLRAGHVPTACSEGSCRLRVLHPPPAT